MNLNRRRNIFTLGDFQIGVKENAKKRQLFDPFAKDPFKIQSYNFRYADRPSFFNTSLQPTINNHDNINDCQTFFYNYDFPNTNANMHRSSVLHNDERILNLTKFQEQRRRKFLQDSRSSRNFHLSRSNNICNTLKQKPFNNSSLRCANQLSKYTPNLSMNQVYTQTAKSNDYLNEKQIFTKRSLTPVHQEKTYQSLSSTSRDSNVKRGSGCDININIKGLENNSLQDNVSIKIETDSISKNLNLTIANSRNTFQNKNPRIEHFDSSQTFVVDKKLSKYSMKRQDSQDRDRIKNLISIYSSQIPRRSTTTLNVKLKERLPSLIPLDTNSSIGGNNNSCRMKDKSINSYFLKDSKTVSASFSYNNNFQNNPHNILNSNSKRLNSQKEASQYSLTTKSNRFEYKNFIPLRLRSKTKSLLNLNINVYADKLKLIKV